MYEFMGNAILHTRKLEESCN